MHTHSRAYVNQKKTKPPFSNNYIYLNHLTFVITKTTGKHKTHCGKNSPKHIKWILKKVKSKKNYCL